MSMGKLQSNFTAPEQSKRLLKLGVPADSADCIMKNNKHVYKYNFDMEPTMTQLIERLNTDDCMNVYKPCWSVGRLIEIHLKCCTTLNQNDAHIVISRFGIETEGLLQNMYDVVCECALLGRYDFSKLEE